MPGEIIFTFPRDRGAKVTIEVNGVKGQTCQALTANIEKALGNVTADVETPEMYEQPEEVHHHLRQQNG